MEGERAGNAKNLLLLLPFLLALALAADTAQPIWKGTAAVVHLMA
jgi:hypothetical protein